MLRAPVARVGMARDISMSRGKFRMMGRCELWYNDVTVTDYILTLQKISRERNLGFL